MHDVHCHLDLYDDPYAVARATEAQGLFSIAVTNLPSAYSKAAPHMRPFKHWRLALGLHPLLAEHHTVHERKLFAALLHETSYVGEVGLDFSPEGTTTKDAQIDTLRFVLSLLKTKHKVVSVHSRRAENAVLDLWSESGVSPVVFHWYSGPLLTLDRILARGHYFSVNPSMLRSNQGKRVIERMSPSRVLTETDGPFVRVAGRPAIPSDVAQVQEFLAACWRRPSESVASQLSENLATLLAAQDH